MSPHVIHQRCLSLYGAPQIKLFFDMTMASLHIERAKYAINSITKLEFKLLINAGYEDRIKGEDRQSRRIMQFPEKRREGLGCQELSQDLERLTFYPLRTRNSWI